MARSVWLVTAAALAAPALAASQSDVLWRYVAPQAIKFTHIDAAGNLLVAMDTLANAENVGVLVRNCAAFGVQAIVVGETSSSPYLRRAVRSSMGTVFRLPVIEAVRLTHTLRELQAAGIRCIAAHPRNDNTSLSRADFTSDCCLVFGSEGAGISGPVLAACDEAVAIPMPPEVDSLNVGSASAAFLYEACRQRGRI